MKKKLSHLFGVLALILFMCNACTQNSTTTLHVSVNGNDSNTGYSVEESLKTLQVAKLKVRELRKNGTKGNIEVIVHGGTYYMDETLVFTNEDSAPLGSYTTFKGAEGETPILSGGKKISNWKKAETYPEYLPEKAKSNVWVTELEWLSESNRFHALMLGDRFLKRARSKAIEVYSQGLKEYKHNHMDEMKYRTQFHYKLLDGDHPFRSWNNIEDIELYIQPTKKWLVNYLPLSEVNQVTKHVKLVSQATYSIAVNPGYVENAIDYLDEPGEWCVNTVTKKMYYWPENGEPNPDIMITYLDEIIRVEGVSDSSLKGDKEQPVRGLVFEGLTLAHADRQRWEPTDIGLQHDWDMWDKINGLIRFRSSEDCRISNCKFINTASDGVRLDRYAQNITIENSHFENLGGVGVLMAGYGPGKKDVNHHNTVSHNVMTKTGQIFLHSPAVFVWQSGHNEISNNHVYDLGYTGMVFSGVRRRFFHSIFNAENPFANFTVPKGVREHIPTVRWDEVSLEHGIENWDSYEPFMHTRGNKIMYNEIHDCMKLLHDGNAIYMSANGIGNEISHNVVYNHPKGGSIRTDDDSHGCTIKGNLVFGTLSPLAIRVKGLNKTVNNYLINAYFTTGFAGNTCDSSSIFKHNVTYHLSPKANFPFHQRLVMVKGKNFDNNIYYHPDEELLKEKICLQKTKTTKGQDTNSLFSDPMFTNIDAGDFSLKAKSPALKLGVESLPSDFLNKIGPSYDPFINRFNLNKEKLLLPKKFRKQRF
ncbi:MAG: right-handed parallel beta-helix repeat-containing protein [Carboxylicivirga sp.]|jgi:hypothetical protein|nr:right-handed parallel beta-helix repeat-containing protein [Carboxylicivirga sp.]